MKGKSLVYLILFAIVIVGFAYYTSHRDRRGAAPAEVGRKLVPGLAVNDIEKMTLVSVGSTASVLRTKEAWVVPEKFNYPADFNKICRALQALADLKIGQVIPTTPAQKADLNLLSPRQPATPDQEGHCGTEIALSGGQGKSPLTLLIGKQHEQSGTGGSPGGYPDGRYVAGADGKVCLVTDMLMEFGARSEDWLDHEFLTIPAQDLSRVTITAQGRDRQVLARATVTNELTLAGLTTNEVTDSSRLTMTLGYLRFDDIADPTLTPAQTGLDQPTTVEAETFDGHRYTLKLGKTPAPKSQRYLTVTVTCQPPPEPVAATNAPAATNDVARVTAQQEQQKKVEEAQALNARLSRWIYLVGSGTSQAIAPARSELIKKPTPPPKEEEADRVSDVTTAAGVNEMIEKK